VASPDYLKRHGEPKTPEAISRHETIRFGPATSWHFVKDGRDVEVTPAPRFISNSSDAALQYAETGGGLTRVLAYQAADGLKRGRLRIVLAKFEQPAQPIHIVYPTSRLLSAKVRAFIDLVVETTKWRFG
jgi:DNA-binding transcriptional LysR family regulator